MHSGAKRTAQSRAIILLFNAIVVALLFNSVRPALADYDRARTWFIAQSEKDRILLQVDLILSGQYNGLADGVFGKNTYSALTGFQAAEGYPATGVLSARQRDLLTSVARNFYQRVGFNQVDDDPTGISLFIPSELVAPAGFGKRGSKWESRRGHFEIETVLVPASEMSFFDVYSKLIRETRSRKVTYSTVQSDFFVVSGRNGKKNFYAKLHAGPYDTRGFSISWDSSVDHVGKITATFMASMMSFSAETTGPIAESPPAQAPQPATPDEPDGVQSSGSAFVVSENGLAVTNNHVIDNCRDISVTQYVNHDVRLISRDLEADLALIKIEGLTGVPFATVRATPPRLGEDIVVMGYPIGDLMGNELQVQPGNVNSLSGLLGDKSTFTMNASAQPGNSGGPVFDRNGQVVGVVVSHINNKKALDLLGTTLSNYNFAIQNTELLDFLSLYRGIQVGRDSAAPLSVEDVANANKRVTVQVICK